MSDLGMGMDGRGIEGVEEGGGGAQHREQDSGEGDQVVQPVHERMHLSFSPSAASTLERKLERKQRKRDKLFQHDPLLKATMRTPWRGRRQRDGSAVRKGV